MCGTIGTARQASKGTPTMPRQPAGPHPSTAPLARPPASAVVIPPLADPQGNDVTGRWPLRSFLELGALRSTSSRPRPFSVSPSGLTRTGGSGLASQTSTNHPQQAMGPLSAP